LEVRVLLVGDDELGNTRWVLLELVDVLEVVNVPGVKLADGQVVLKFLIYRQGEVFVLDEFL
jgi:hypothetical protein